MHIVISKHVLLGDSLLSETLFFSRGIDSSTTFPSRNLLHPKRLGDSGYRFVWLPAILLLINLMSRLGVRNILAKLRRV